MKYINAEKLIHDLEERIYAYSEGYANGDDCRKDAIETLLKDVKYQLSLQQEQPSLPPDLDEAARDFAKTAFKKPYSNNPDEEVTIVEPDKYAGFIAGAKWDREQMMSKAVECIVEDWNPEPHPEITIPLNPEEFSNGNRVHIIIVKEDVK